MSVVTDFDEVEAALFAVLVNRAGFERAGVEGPAFEFEALVRVAERDVVNERAKLFELLDGERGDGSVELALNVRVQHQYVEEAFGARVAECFGEDAHRGIGRGAVPVRAEDARALDVYV